MQFHTCYFVLWNTHSHTHKEILQHFFCVPQKKGRQAGSQRHEDKCIMTEIGFRTFLLKERKNVVNTQDIFDGNVFGDNAV